MVCPVRTARAAPITGDQRHESDPQTAHRWRDGRRRTRSAVHRRRLHRHRQRADTDQLIRLLRLVRRGPPPHRAGPTVQTPDWSKGGHQANGITETVLTGDDLTKADAAAEAAVPGATAQRAETDAEGATYEVHMTKSDGSIVTVKLDANFNVTGTVDGMG